MGLSVGGMTDRLVGTAEQGEIQYYSDQLVSHLVPAPTVLCRCAVFKA